jgi:hypothetical protein
MNVHSEIWSDSIVALRTHQLDEADVDEIQIIISSAVARPKLPPLAIPDADECLLNLLRSKFKRMIQDSGNERDFDGP